MSTKPIVRSTSINKHINNILNNENIKAISRNSSKTSISMLPDNDKTMSTDDVDDDDMKPTTHTSTTTGQASTIACISALCNTILGSGMLAIPYAMSQCGYILGIILLILGACASSFALHLLSLCANKVSIKPTSFYIVANASVPQFTFLIDLAVAIKCFGVATSYLIVVGDLMPDAINVLLNDIIDNNNHILYDRRLWIIIFFIAIILPLSCLRTLNSLRFTAIISVIIVWGITMIVASYAWLSTTIVGDICPSNNITCHGDTSYFNVSLQTLKISTIFIFGYTCHQNIFSVCNELKQSTQQRIDYVIYTAISIALTVYICISISGYHTFGIYTHSNILTNYSANNTIIAIARILVAINVSFCYPLQLHPCRNSLFELVKQYKNKYNNNTSSDTNKQLSSYKPILSSTTTRPTHIKAKPSDTFDNIIYDNNNHSDGTSSTVMNERSPLLSTLSHTTSNNDIHTIDIDNGNHNHSNVDYNNQLLHNSTWKPTEYQISMLTTIITLISFTISMYVSNLGTVLSVVGATGSTTISYILPGLCYIQLFKQWNIKRIAACILLCAGIIIVPSALCFIFLLPGSTGH